MKIFLYMAGAADFESFKGELILGNQFIGSTEAEQKEMLAALGVSSLEELMQSVVPKEHQHPGQLLELGPAKSEQEVETIIRSLVSRNTNFDPSASFLGGGHYQRLIPQSVSEIVLRGEWMTPYTPYQPEVSQGILRTLFDFQSLMAELTGMAVINAGVYHGVNAGVEAAFMACRITGKNKVLVSEATNPVLIKNLATYFTPKDIELVLVPTKGGVTTAESIDALADDKTAAVIVQNPNFWGLLDGMDGQAEAAHHKKALYVIFGGGDQVSLAMLKKPSEYGADIYAGEGQHFGNPIGYGGPHVGVLGIANRDVVRQLPGRLVLQAKDIAGREGYRLGLQTREQHIRRERATSNTCTAETLMAVMDTAYLAVMGPSGLKGAAQLSYDNAHYTAREVSRIPGFSLLHPNKEFFNEIAVKTPVAAAQITDELAEQGLLAGIPVARSFPYNPAILRMDNVLLIAATEVNTNLRSLNKLVGGLRRYEAAN